MAGWLELAGWDWLDWLAGWLAGAGWLVLVVRGLARSRAGRVAAATRHDQHDHQTKPMQSSPTCQMHIATMTEKNSLICCRKPKDMCLSLACATTDADYQSRIILQDNALNLTVVARQPHLDPNYALHMAVRRVLDTD